MGTTCQSAHILPSQHQALGAEAGRRQKPREHHTHICMQVPTWPYLQCCDMWGSSTCPNKIHKRSTSRIREGSGISKLCCSYTTKTCPVMWFISPSAALHWHECINFPTADLGFLHTSTGKQLFTDRTGPCRAGDGS